MVLEKSFHYEEGSSAYQATMNELQKNQHTPLENQKMTQQEIQEKLSLINSTTMLVHNQRKVLYDLNVSLIQINLSFGSP